MRTVYVGNNTGDYHGGSWAVCRQIEAVAREAGWQVVWERDRARVEVEAIAECDAVLVNGEGTLHDDKPRALHLMAILDHAHRSGKPTGLCNATWMRMGSWSVDVLKRVDHVSVRDGISWNILADECGVSAERHFDLAYAYGIDIPASTRPVRFLVTDLYSAEFDAFVIVNGGAWTSLPRLNMRVVDWAGTIEAVSSSRVFITGRFHGLVAACKTRTRFVAYPGNTHKMEGVLSWFGKSVGFTRDATRLLAMAKASHQSEALYDELFDWVAALPRWRFPF